MSFGATGRALDEACDLWKFFDCDCIFLLCFFHDYGADESGWTFASVSTTLFFLGYEEAEGR